MKMWIAAAVAVTCVAPVFAEGGAAVFSKHCENCHGKGAKGANAPALVPYDRDLSELSTIVRLGIGMMPAFPRDQLTDTDIEQIQTYLKALPAKDMARRSEPIRRTGARPPWRNVRMANS